MAKPRKIASFFLHASWPLKKDVLRITLLYIRVTCMTRLLPIRFYYKRYFNQRENETIDLLEHEEKLSRIRKTLCNLPGRYTCLKECIVVHLYFKRHGIYVPLYLGVNVENGFKAHAWYDPEKSNSFCQVE